MKIALLSNINVNMIVQKLSSNIEIYNPEGYNTWVQDLLQKNSKLFKFTPQLIFILLDGYELFNNVEQSNIENSINQYLSYIETSVKSNPDIIYFISDIDMPTRKLQAVKDYRIEKEIEFFWYKQLYELSKKYKNVYILNIKRIIDEIGRENFYSNKMWYLAGSKYSVKAEKQIIKLINQNINAILGKRKKCLVLDLDNTLWGGVIGEDGIDGVSLSDNKEGASYKDFQRRIKELKDTGIILSIASKNNYKDAIDMIKNHTDMVLREEDFVSLKINWNLKSQSIREISEELNIGRDSLVFIDDNPVERSIVSSEMPEVIVPEFPKDTCDLEKFIIDIYNDYFLILDVSEEDKKKTEMYEQNYKREKEQKLYSSIDDYLKSLNTEIYINKIRDEDIQRVAQLTQKTNQFNLTTKRYTEADILNMSKDDEHIIYVATIKDKFGDNGKCVVVIIKKIDQKTADIDTFVMSCRVMGRFIEDSIISFIENDLKKLGFNEIRAHYYPTEKNIPVKELFERLEYSIIKNDISSSNKDYFINLENISSIERKNFCKIIYN